MPRLLPALPALPALPLLPAIAAAQTRPTTAAIVHEVDSLAKAFVAAGTTPSIAMAVTRVRNTVVMSAWGKPDIEQSVNATTMSVYEIGSAIK